MIDVTIKRSKDDVNEAVVQFCARRAYRLTAPWHGEGLRIEAPFMVVDTPARRGFWATVMDTQAVPRIDLVIKRKRTNQTRVKVTVTDHPGSLRLAYELQAYLNEDAAYDTQCPPLCPSCGSTVPNPIARYCGRCGFQFAKDGTPERPRILNPPPVIPSPAKAGAKNESKTRREAVAIERDEDEVTIVETIEIDAELESSLPKEVADIEVASIDAAIAPEQVVEALSDDAIDAVSDELSEVAPPATEAAHEREASEANSVDDDESPEPPRRTRRMLAEE